MTDTVDPTNITIVGTGDYAMAFDGQKRFAIGDTDDVRAAVLDRLGVTHEWSPMNVAILGNRGILKAPGTLDEVRALIPAAEAHAAAETAAHEASEAFKIANREARLADRKARRARSIAEAAKASAIAASAAAELSTAEAAEKAAAVAEREAVNAR